MVGYPPSSTAGYRMELTDAQWAVSEPLIPEAERAPSGPGRPWRPAREVFNGVLWIWRTGARWQALPDRYPPYQTWHRRFQQWVDSGVFDHLLQASAEDLLARGGLDLSRSEEHTSELQSRQYLVCRLLLEKKK